MTKTKPWKWEGRPIDFYRLLRRAVLYNEVMTEQGKSWDDIGKDLGITSWREESKKRGITHWAVRDACYTMARGADAYQEGCEAGQMEGTLSFIAERRQENPDITNSENWARFRASYIEEDGYPVECVEAALDGETAICNKKVQFQWDAESQRWIATSDEVPGLVLEDSWLEDLIGRVRYAIIDLRELNNERLERHDE